MIQKMKILVLNDAEAYSIGWSYTHAFRELGHEVTLFDPQQGLRKLALWRFPVSRRLLERQIITAYNRKLIDQICEMPADVIWVGKGSWAVPEFWHELKRRRPDVQLVCYNGDNPIVTFSRGGNRPWVTESIPCFDLFCTYNKSLLTPLLEAGAKKVACIPFAWDPKLHPDLEPTEEEREHYRCDAIFVGNGDAHREMWMKQIMEIAMPYNWRFAIYGHWNHCKDKMVLGAVRGGPVYGAEMVKAMRSSKVAINILRIQNDGTHNMRTFETPGCGGVLASQASPEQEGYFPEGKAAIYFTSAAECVEKMRTVIENDSYQNSLAQGALEIARHHTYRHRAESILDALAR